ncbi:hypothetical protein CHS0354_014647 [Potamilus streckersoni]|uniref:Uncharacterized protein n=1 Tax=Potamilus streckersoni TaxID=2493646 RepID=A0AAE0SPU3_9BIVA|nr:hypothetical protein CHS0354_014647 [Potamilus streckersoni]
MAPVLCWILKVSAMTGAINSTAANIEVKSYTYPPPPTLRDFMNPKVGDKILDTDNMYQQELLTGTQQHLQPFGDTTKILMETNNKYKKQFQPTFPPEPQEWYPETDKEKEKKMDRKQIKKYERGHKRWKGLPEPVDDTADIVQYMLPDKEFQKSADPRARKTAKSNQSLMQIIDEWRTKWHLTGQYADSNPDDLIRDMADIQPHVRLKAIATAAKAAEYRPPPNQGIQLDYMGKEAIEPEHVPERLVVAIECLLDDTEDKIRMVAAITLYSLNRPTQKATDILYDALQSETPIDRWAAAQCLAHFGVCDSDVIGEILRQVMTTENTIKHERGISLLGKISISSDKQNGLLNLVHSMVAEQLNSSSWRHKVIACKILPTLHGDINKDITNKLADLMWNDWNAEVRHAAAQCLGKTGHGRDVHDDLRERILNGDERIKLEAISKVGQLGIMTAKLLPVFLKCFEDDYVSVRREVCITCGNLEIREDSVIEKLIHTATFDTVWKIKALAFQALGKIGVVNDAVVDCLLWAVRYEENPGVRAEAAHTLKVLKVKTENVAEVLQDRFLVESNQLVRDEIASALKIFDISATEDMDMVAQIKKEVHKLGTRNIIATQIVLNEKDEERQQNMARMIFRSETETKIIRILYHNLVPKHMRHPGSIHFREPLADVKVFSQETEEKNESLMDRVQAMSQAESRSLTPTHKTPIFASPELGREGIVFTPTADKELEAILSREDVTTPVTTEPSSSGLKLRTETGSSGEVGEESLTEKGDEEGDGSSQMTHTPGETTEGEEVEPELDEMKGEKLQEKDKKDKLEVFGDERPSSTVRFAPHLEVTDIPARITTPLGPSRLSLMGDVKGSRLSTAGFTSDRGTIFSRDAIKEREKINAEARNTYAGLDNRYSDMIDDLEKVDNTFGEFVEVRRRLSAERYAEENRKNKPIKVLSLPKIELMADEVFDVESNDGVEEDSNDKSEDDKSATRLLV